MGTVYLTESDSILGIEFRQGGLNFSSISFSKLTSSELQGDQEPGAIEIFPVPARDRLSIHGLHHPSSVRIYDMNGRELFHYPSLSPQNVYINISDFENGVYFMKIENGSELHGIKKFIKIS